jgi:hypothetical protein
VEAPSSVRNRNIDACFLIGARVEFNFGEEGKEFSACCGEDVQNVSQILPLFDSTSSWPFASCCVL